MNSFYYQLFCRLEKIERIIFEWFMYDNLQTLLYGFELTVLSTFFPYCITIRY